jgi:hypothetical protein
VTTIIELVRGPAKLTDADRIRIVKSKQFARFLQTRGYWDYEFRVDHLSTDDGDTSNYRWSIRNERKRAVALFRRMVRQGFNFDREVRTIADLKLKATAKGVRQISGDSLMLADFWQRAAELAERRGLCGMYDAFAAALGGPRRR